MAASEMYDYLSAVTPDVDVTLSVTPQRVIIEEGDFNQTPYEADDTSEEVITHSSTPRYYVMLQFSRRSESDIGTIFDIYFDTAKAYGIGNSFKWAHQDGHTYVVKFRDKFSRQLSVGGPALPIIYGLPSVRLKVLGRIDD